MPTYNSDGSVANINALIAGAADGDIITIPAGSFNWGAGSTYVDLNKAVTLQGAGTSSTIITVNSGAPGNSGVVQIFAAATVKDFAVIPSAGDTLFGVNANGFHITNIVYNQAGASIVAYFALINYGYGLIDYNDVTAGGGNNELIFGQGPDDSWDTAYEGGTANAVYIERNHFRFPTLSSGYVCDANSNARFVVRFNYIHGLQKIDGHGYNTNSSPARGVRAMEIYGNFWDDPRNPGSWAAIEVRGGVGYIFNNVVKPATSTLGYYRFRDYGVDAPGSNYGGVYQTPEDLPLRDGIGNGPGAIGAQAQGGQPYYFFSNYKGGAAANSINFRALEADVARYTTTAGYAVGASNISLTGGSAQTGNYIKFSSDSTYYLITSGYSGSSGTITISPTLQVEILAGVARYGSMGPTTNYRGQTGDPAATFTMGPTPPCIVDANLDYFASTASFTGASGVGRGTAAQMAAITPSADKVGFWVTDEGSWNASFVGTINADAIDEWYFCEIVSVGTTDFTLIGAPANTVGITFMATGAGTGTGTVKPAQGQFYTADSGSWNLDLTPYAYPFGGEPPPTPPSLNSATINSTGTTMTLGFSVSCTTGAGGNGGVTLSASGGAVTWTYASGSGSTVYVGNLSRAILSSETVTVSYVQPGDGIESTVDQVDLADFSNEPVTNGSTVNNTQAAVRRAGAFGGGF
jgi:hypothetical protein